MSTQTTRFPFIKHFTFIGALLAAPAVFAHAPLTGHEFLKDAQVNLTDARAAALKTYPGKIADEELEKEKGGSGLRYSFAIRNGKVAHEVGVDAKTGAILENSVEGTNAD
ncbi:MAG: PepSY domain-containing protein [Stenotrophobium sp.]